MNKPENRGKQGAQSELQKAVNARSHSVKKQKESQKPS